MSHSLCSMNSITADQVLEGVGQVKVENCALLINNVCELRVIKVKSGKSNKKSYFFIADRKDSELKVVAYVNFIELSRLIFEQHKDFLFWLVKYFQISNVCGWTIPKYELNRSDVISWFVPCDKGWIVVVESVWCIRAHLILFISVENKANFIISSSNIGFNSFSYFQHHKIDWFLKTPNFFASPKVSIPNLPWRKFWLFGVVLTQLQSANKS